MKEYVFTVLMVALMITIVAVAAGTIVYLRAKHGASSLTFQLSRIGIVWATLIALLLLGGFYIITTTGWTVDTIKSVFGAILAWTKENRLMASIIMWTATILVMLLLYHLQVCTLSVAIIVWLLHVWATYITWGDVLYDFDLLFFWGTYPTGKMWTLAKAILATVIICGVRADRGFQELDGRNPHDNATERSNRKTAPEVIGDMIAECAETITKGITPED